MELNPGEGPRRGRDRGSRDAKIARLYAREVIDSSQFGQFESSWEASIENCQHTSLPGREDWKWWKGATAPQVSSQAAGRRKEPRPLIRNGEVRLGSCHPCLSSTVQLTHSKPTASGQ